MPCYHKNMKEYLTAGLQGECPDCERDCVACLDCGKIILQDTSDLYDGARCSRCFDKFNIAERKGIFSKGSKQDVANQYGCYKNVIEWDQKEHRYARYKKKSAAVVRPVKVIRMVRRTQDQYEYDDFCVPDDEIEYEDGYGTE